MCIVADFTRTIHLSNGVSLDYRESGDPDGEPMIMLHGVTDSHQSWRPFAEELPHGIRAIALTQRGHGDSSKPHEGYGAADFAADLVEFMDALRIERAHICAHSMSTWIAQRFARDYTARVASLTLIGGFVTLADNPAVESLSEEIVAFGEHIPFEFVRGFQEATVATPVPEEFLQMVVDESMKVPAHVWRSAFAAMAATKREKGRINVPALLLAGEKDAFFPESVLADLRRVFVSPSEITYDGLGHALHWEAPEFVAGDVARFVMNVAGTGAKAGSAPLRASA